MERNYGLDPHCQMIIDDYREHLDIFIKMRDVIETTLREQMAANDLMVTAVESRVKAEASLAGKLELKGSKYRGLEDITDIIGARVITLFTDDVDKVASIAENFFDVDWDNSVDKRKMHDLNSFGYMSLHYICRIPKRLYCDPAHPEINSIRWELQLRTTLQHMWANMSHDTGYKSGVEIPHEYLRTLNSLAGLLEIADNEFSRLRIAINDFKRRVTSLVRDGQFNEVLLDIDTYRSYIKLGPFDSLNANIAAINQAEIHKVSLMPYLEYFKTIGFKTLGDIDNMIRSYSEEAYMLARYELGKTDLDIVSSSVGVQNLCTAMILLKGEGIDGLKLFFDTIFGESPYNKVRSERITEEASRLPFMKK